VGPEKEEQDEAWRHYSQANAIGTRGNGSRSAADHDLRLRRLAPHGNPPPISPNRRKMMADRTVDRSAPHQKWFSKFLITYLSVLGLQKIVL
jgi:hypothetical protein